MFRSLWFISGGGEVIGAFLRGEGVDAGGDGAVELVERSGCGLAQQRLELGESVLDRDHVRISFFLARRALRRSWRRSCGVRRGSTGVGGSTGGADSSYLQFGLDSR